MKNFKAEMNDMPVYIVPQSSSEPYLVWVARTLYSAGLNVMFGKEEK